MDTSGDGGVTAVRGLRQERERERVWARRYGVIARGCGTWSNGRGKSTSGLWGGGSEPWMSTKTSCMGFSRRGVAEWDG